MGFKAISETLQEIIVEMYDADVPIKVIADDLRIYHGTVRKYLMREGRLEHDPEVIEQARRRYTDEERAFAVELYNSGVEVAEIQELTGMSAPTIYNHVKKQGGLRTTPEKDIEKAVKMYARNQYSVLEILEKTGVPRTTFYQRVNELKATGEL